MQQESSRRLFLSQVALASGVAALPRSAWASTIDTQFCVFSKHLQWKEIDAAAETAARLGFDGLDLTVRPGGHISPEEAVAKLPGAVRSAKKAGIEIATIATAINDPDDPLTEKILGTAAQQGIRYYRLGYYQYTDDQSVQATVREAASKFEKLARLNEKHRICGDYQNHAGRGYFGASLWDLWQAMRNTSKEWLGCQFDLRHATVEGFESWPTDFRLIADRVHTIIAKDFIWADKKGSIENCPLGEGATPFVAFLPMLRDSAFAGPISLHLEYPLGGANHGDRKLTASGQVVLDAMRRDLAVLKRWMAEA
jgi:sugar phosphate isomerase/epimerase